VEGGGGLEGCFSFSYQKMKKKDGIGEKRHFFPQKPKKPVFFVFYSRLKNNVPPPTLPPHSSKASKTPKKLKTSRGIIGNS